MRRVAFRMQLHPGSAAEYKHRHDNLWPELRRLLKSSGISNYFIFLDETTNSLFASFDIENISSLDHLPQHPTMQKWWLHMKDLMETNPDNSPFTIPLKEVFHLT
jgi:L-rhamnose mutarotase